MKSYDIFDWIFITIVIFVSLWFLVSFLMLPRKVQDLEERIDSLEQRNLEAHEYILNKIGG